MEGMVYTIIWWLTGIVAFFMVFILILTHVETKNSKRVLALKLATHYNHQFHEMWLIFDRHNCFKVNLQPEEITAYFRRYQSQIIGAMPVLTEMLKRNCENNHFPFVPSESLREHLTMKSRHLIDQFTDYEASCQQMIQLKTNDKEAVSDLWDTMCLYYDQMVHEITACYHLLSNEVVYDIL